MNQQKEILDYLKQNKRGITSLEAQLKLGIGRLAARVHDINSTGFKVEKEMITVKNRRGDDCRVANYYLTEVTKNEIMITLQQIRDHSPCEDGWKKVYKYNNGDMETPFPLKSILESNDLNDCLWALRCLPEYDNLWRLYAVWCARQVEHLMTDARSKAALDVAERFANGNATQEELTAAWDAAWAAGDAARDAWAAGVARAAAGDAARAAWAAGDAARAAWAAARAAAWAAAGAAGDAAWAAVDAARDAAWAAGDAQKAKIIEILTAGEWVKG